MQVPDARHELGRRGEKLAAEYLVRRGFSILERNWKKQIGRRWWEIDIIAQKSLGFWPFSRKRRVVFVEVKTVRKTGHFGNVQKESGHFSGHPELQVDIKRQRRLASGARMYLAENAIPTYSDWQIDVIAVMIDPQTNEAEIRHTERAVEDFS